MSPILSILRATHCRSTHHYFAIDALRLVQTDAGLRFRAMLLKHHEKFLTGAKDPDVRFRDFQNHVIHVQDGYFGGAPRLAIMWYDRLMGHLVSGRRDQAAYAMGVLSHYFTDPLMPLHTAQIPRKALVHRPMEWSICKSYDRILKRWTQDNLRLVFQLGDGDGWLGEAILKGARFANRSYKRLVETYDVNLGVENPVAGLDEQSLQTFAELFGLAITGLARLIERAAAEAEARSGAPLPSVSLTMPALLAALQIPEQTWLKRIEDKSERKAIEAIIAEFRETGEVKQNIPDEVYIKQLVMQVREREVLWAERQRHRIAAQNASGAEIVSTTPPEVQTDAPESKTLETIAKEQPAERHESVLAASSAPPPADESLVDADPQQDEIVSLPFSSSDLIAKGKHRKHLQLTDELSDAPSIGPKTAAAFAAIKVLTIGDFLAAPAASLAKRINKSWITTQVVADWQSQTRLMHDVPGLLARDVLMLVDVGCRTADQLATVDAASLVKQMNRYAQLAEGRRALRGAAPADIELVESWIASAASHRVLRKSA